MGKTELYISAIKKGRQGSGKAECGEDISDKRYVRVGVGCVLQSIIQNSFGYAVISAVLKRKRLLICYSRKVAKTELYISAIKKGRQGSGKAESGEDISDKRYVRVGVGCVLQSIIRNTFGYAVISAVLKRKRLLICNSRKVAKTEL